MANSGDSGPDESIHLYYDGHGVMAIEGSTGLRGGGDTVADALHTLANEIQKREGADSPLPWEGE